MTAATAAVAASVRYNSRSGIAHHNRAAGGCALTDYDNGGQDGGLQ